MSEKITKEMDLTKFQWTREPESCVIGHDRIEIMTRPHTDLWQRTYYHFRNDNAPVLQMETEEPYFSFVVKTSFEESHHRFDQCGIVMYLDSENWLKGSIEYENENYQHLGSVVTNNGYSDWATTVIDASVKSMWYRFSRREDDYCIECSFDGEIFEQMRICHMHCGKGKIRFGIYACSPEDSSFKAVFTGLQLMDCQWKAHDGQQPDQDGYHRRETDKVTGGCRMEIMVRACEENDIPDMVRIWNEVVEDGIAFPQEELLTLQSGTEFFASQTYNGVAVDQENGRVLGLYILHPNNVGRCGHICNASYAVSRESRGLHVGEKLVLDCLMQGRLHGFRVLQFNAVVASNIHARHLYERLGFVQLGTIPGGFRMKDGHYEDICPYYHEL